MYLSNVAVYIWPIICGNRIIHQRKQNSPWIDSNIAKSIFNTVPPLLLCLFDITHKIHDHREFKHHNSPHVSPSWWRSWSYFSLKAPLKSCWLSQSMYRPFISSSVTSKEKGAFWHYNFEVCVVMFARDTVQCNNSHHTAGLPYWSIVWECSKQFCFSLSLSLCSSSFQEWVSVSFMNTDHCSLLLPRSGFHPKCCQEKTQEARKNRLFQFRSYCWSQNWVGEKEVCCRTGTQDFVWLFSIC